MFVHCHPLNSCLLFQSFVCPFGIPSVGMMITTFCKPSIKCHKGHKWHNQITTIYMYKLVRKMQSQNLPVQNMHNKVVAIQFVTTLHTIMHNLLLHYTPLCNICYIVDYNIGLNCVGGQDHVPTICGWSH